jgi:thiol-disulfide isomerase/thioredoxin
MKKLATLLALTLLLSACGNAGVEMASEDFVAGNGATTYIQPSERVAAPALSGMTLLGTQYSLPANEVAVVNVWASWCSPCRSPRPYPHT